MSTCKVIEPVELSCSFGVKCKEQKHGNDYLATVNFSPNETLDTSPAQNKILDDKNYTALQRFKTESFNYHSKPGVYGWNKIDKGSELLVNTFKDSIKKTAFNIPSFNARVHILENEVLYNQRVCHLFFTESSLIHKGSPTPG